MAHHEDKNRVTSSDGSAKVFKCVFFDDVLCSFRKYEGRGMMERCENCEVFKEWMRLMDEADMWEEEEIDRMRDDLEKWGSGDLDVRDR